MKVRFACPSCAAAGTVDAVHIGKQVRCKHCGGQFVIPNPQAAEPEVYALDEPVKQSASESKISPADHAVFVPARSDRLRSADRPGRVQAGITVTATSLTRVRKPDSGFRWQAWMIRGGIALVVILTGIALLAPHGTWLAGCTLIVIGGLLVPLAFLAGAYGAFSEELLYGFLYLAIPLYAAYYLVTRWDDVWPWVVCATAGVGLVLLGTELVRWSGVAV